MKIMQILICIYIIIKTGGVLRKKIIGVNEFSEYMSGIGLFTAILFPVGYVSDVLKVLCVAHIFILHYREPNILLRTVYMILCIVFIIVCTL